MKFKTQWNADQFPKNREYNEMPSETVPDQAMSMAEIMRRFASGLPIEGERVPLYEGEDPVPDFAGMDLAEREQAILDTAEELEDIKTRLNKKAESAAAAEFKKQQKILEKDEIPFEEIPKKTDDNKKSDE